MSLIVTKTEVSAVVELLESEEYETPEEMAKDIIRTITDMRDQRKQFVVAAKPRDDKSAWPFMATGPFPTMDSARKAVAAGHVLILPQYKAYLGPLHSVAYWKERLA